VVGRGGGPDSTTAGPSPRPTRPLKASPSNGRSWRLKQQRSGDRALPPAGTTNWKTGMALFRIPAAATTPAALGRETASGRTSTRGACSTSTRDILRDRADAHRSRRWIDDPSTTVATRPIPQASTTATTKAVTPANFSAMLAGAAPATSCSWSRQLPAFTVSRSGADGKPIVLRGTSVDGL